ncbi:MAG TPA: YihY/virulence factor BrkB family protein [Mycobacteriales bacterium]|nr:YihY/virulence factor BrkB family protein [Mycobacteriales bacterium]
MPARPALDNFQRRHRWLGLPIAVVYKYVDDQGSYLAALITYYGFLSLFPLLLLAATILGFVLNGDSALQQKLLGSALRQFPIIGKQLTTNIHGYRGSGAGLVIGLLVAIYGGLGIAQAGQNAMNVVWAVPRNARPNPLMARVRSLALLATLGIGVLVTTALSAAGAVAHDWSKHQGLGATGVVLVIAASAVVNIGLFLVAFRFLTTHDIGWRDIWLGAVVSAVAWQVLQLAGAYYVAHELRGAQEVYGTFALVLGLIAWIYLEAVVFVLAAELNVVVRRHLWPRALLTPFTDDVDLTRADERAYGSYAKAQKAKGYEHIDVEFNPPSG